jgi:hypothetical protein
MVNLGTLLIPESLLMPLYGEASAKSSTSDVSAEVTLSGTPYEQPYLNYLVLTQLHEKLPCEWQSDSLVLYNRYFWFLRFAKIRSEQHGKDPGIEQQAFQILENAMADIDWTVVEAIDEAVHEE